MRTAKWKEYELIDTSDGERLERWGSVVLIRPDPQIIWKTPRENPLWEKADARYLRQRRRALAGKPARAPDVEDPLRRADVSA